MDKALDLSHPAHRQEWDTALSEYHQAMEDARHEFDRAQRNATKHLELAREQLARHIENGLKCCPVCGGTGAIGQPYSGTDRLCEFCGASGEVLLDWEAKP